MSQASEQFSIEVPISKVNAACTRAIGWLGWRLTSHEANEFQVMTTTDWRNNQPSKLKLALQSTPDGHTTVVLDGQLFGVGPLVKRALADKMSQLREAVTNYALDPASVPVSDVAKRTAKQRAKASKLAAKQESRRRAREQRRYAQNPIANCTHQLARRLVEGRRGIPPDQLRDKPVQCSCGRYFNDQMQEVPAPAWIQEVETQRAYVQQRDAQQQQRRRRSFWFVWWN